MKKSIVLAITLVLLCNFFKTVKAQDIYNDLGGNSSNVGFYIRDNNFNKLFTCLGNGFVGIGTENPNNYLTVVAPSGGDGISVLNSSGDRRILMSIAGGSWGFLELHNSEGNRAYFTPLGSFFNYPDYKIGIGLDNPSANLHVAGNDGVLFTGNAKQGNIPKEGPGLRMMWFPQKAAFRAGTVDGDEWDEENIGLMSVAMGGGTKASGDASVALGHRTEASGDWSTAFGEETTSSAIYSTAMGYYTIASGPASTAMGSYTEARAPVSTAMGSYTLARGNNSIAMGYQTSTSSGAHYATAMGSYVQTGGEGSFTIGDYSTTQILGNQLDNHFRTRFANGYRLYTDSAADTYAELLPGANSWSNTSDSTKKENFRLVDGEEIIQKISKFKLGSWNYKGQDPAKYRHYGPMAQDFYAAFGHDGIGTIGNDTTLSSADFDGINFIAIQALEKRTTDLHSKISELKKENQVLKDEINKLKNNLAMNVEMIDEIYALKEKLNTIIKNVNYSGMVNSNR